MAWGCKKGATKAILSMERNNIWEKHGQNSYDAWGEVPHISTTVWDMDEFWKMLFLFFGRYTKKIN